MASEESRRPSPPKRPPAQYSGLLPHKGWPARNYSFLRHRVIPGMFQARTGTTYPAILTPPEPGRVRITWIGHASFFLQFPNHSLMVDPNWARWHGFVRRLREPGLALNSIPELDLILVTHAHFDHLHKPSLRILKARDGIIVPDGNEKLVRRLGFPKVHTMNLWDEVDIGKLHIIHTPSHHWGARYIHDIHRKYGGYLISNGERSIFHCGDSAWFDGFREIGRRCPGIDVALMPIGAYGAPSGRDVHLNPEEAVQAFADLGAKVMIPMHYRTFPLGTEPPNEPIDRLLQEADRLGISEKIIIPEEGAGIEW